MSTVFSQSFKKVLLSKNATQTNLSANHPANPSGGTRDELTTNVQPKIIGNVRMLANTRTHGLSAGCNNNTKRIGCACKRNTTNAEKNSLRVSHHSVCIFFLWGVHCEAKISLIIFLLGKGRFTP